MVDIETKSIVDLLDSRDTQDVENWLKEYPNIEIVSRDGSFSFKLSIEKAHPNAIQVSDRFHLVKNLIDSIKKSLQKLIIGRIEIPLTSEEAKQRYEYLLGLTRREKIIEAKKMRKNGESFDKIAKQLQISITTASKYAKMDESEIPEEHISTREQEHINAVNKVKSKVEKVKSLKEQGLSVREISKITGYTELKISQYLSENYNIVHGQYGVSRPGPLEPYREEVLTLRAQGVTYKEIAKIISEKGYTGSVAALRGFVSKEKRIAKDLLKYKEPCELIDKKWIIKLLYKPIDKIKGFSQNQLNAVMVKYSIIADLFEVLNEFKNMLKSKDPNNLSNWIEKVKKLNIKEMDSYVNGLERDYDAVINAIILDYNNGLAEGSVNKLKNIKRVMYGRNSFELLRCKVLQLEALKNSLE